MSNDILVYGFCLVSAIACLLAFALFHVYSGIHATLSNAKAGDVYNFEYLQPKDGEPQRYLIKVVDSYSLSDDSIERLNARSNYRRYDPLFKRTRHLVTGRSPDGTIRNFYAERVVNCRKPMLGGLLFRTGAASLFC